jgi:cytochrome c oxidase subunit 2
MPTYQGQISEEGIISLVEYIKNLNSDYRIQQTLNTTGLLPEGEGKTTTAMPGNAGAKAATQGMVKQ